MHTHTRTRSKNRETPVKMPTKLMAKQMMERPRAALRDRSALSTLDDEGENSRDAVTLASWVGVAGRRGVCVARRLG
jgi:uncharacterized protein YciW